MEAVMMCLSLGLLYYILGIAALGGLVVCLLCLPLNFCLMRTVKVLQDESMRLKDERMKVASQSHGLVF
jgi:hypothetical protein